MKETFNNVNTIAVLNMPSPRRQFVTKRMIRSPVETQQTKKCISTSSHPPLKIKVVTQVKLTAFADITNVTRIPESTKPKRTATRSLGTAFETVPTQELHGEVEFNYFVCILLNQFERYITYSLSHW
ncbi:hypothetical protein KP79_PYT01283 [Mizuhopecten yessoensis]|uniref:Uncharacterized protein n=1 Tax=Mizuhopecten yessoensis TaxID=6573 RepID=A0A210QGE7_MIZYE|nr:hypothetical protein KP79_PYT01283 [Mizuhopecten yessoensis]